MLLCSRFPHCGFYHHIHFHTSISHESHFDRRAKKHTPEQLDSANPSEGLAHSPLSFALWNCEALFASVSLNKEVPSTGNKQQSVAAASAA